jgi:hypothetical protein
MNLVGLNKGKCSLKKDSVFNKKMPRDLHMLILKAEKSLICLVATRRPTVSHRLMEQQLIWFLKMLTRNKASK